MAAILRVELYCILRIDPLNGCLIDEDDGHAATTFTGIYWCWFGGGQLRKYMCDERERGPARSQINYQVMVCSVMTIHGAKLMVKTLKQRSFRVVRLRGSRILVRQQLRASDHQLLENRAVSLE
jgi:hypothetical protein